MECRICFGDDHPERMLIPCRCRGSSAYIHDHCFREYIRYYPDRICRVCHGPMEHPWMDKERSLVCAFVLLMWSAVLLTLTTASLIPKLLAFGALAAGLLYHLQRTRMTYEMTFVCLTSSGILVLADPLFLPQTVFFVCGLLLLATVFLFLPIETMLLLLVFGLAILYSVLLTFAVAMRTDPAFTGVFLLALCTFWLVFLRPVRLNEVYP